MSAIKAELNGNLVKRSDKVAYYGIPGENNAVTYTRMQGFTETTKSKNPIEYSRQYVDESFERSDVTGYSTAMSFAFDQYKDNPVHEDMVEMADNDVLGTDAVRDIVLVDIAVCPQKFARGIKARGRRYLVERHGFLGDLAVAPECPPCGTGEDLSVSVRI